MHAKHGSDRDLERIQYVEKLPSESTHSTSMSSELFTLGKFIEQFAPTMTVAKNKICLRAKVVA